MEQGSLGTGRARLTSGIPGLDEVLEGGLFRSSIYVVNGGPGTGKTVMASQICFHAVSRGERAVYVTLFSELHANLIANLESFTFFDPRPISRALKFVSVGRNLADAGPDGLLDCLRGLLHEDRPGVLVIDGFRAAEHATWPSIKLNRFVQGLQALLTLTGTTGLLLSNSPHDRPGAEQYLVEGIVELDDRARGLRGVRTLLVRKFRGGGHLPGRHAVCIDSTGLRVFPRMESRHIAQPTVFTGEDGTSDRVHFGVAGLDQVLGDGVGRGSTTLILGPSGSGKTILGLHFLAEGVRLGEPSLHFGFFETPQALMARARRFGLSIEAARDHGVLDLVWQPPSEQPPDQLAERLLAAVRRDSTSRLFIDGAVGFEQVSDDRRRLGRFFAALSRELSSRGVTTVVSEETRQLFVRDVAIPIEGVSAVWQNILFLRTVECEAELRRVLVVLKTRVGAHDPGLYQFTIGPRGFELGPRVRSTGDVVVAGREPPADGE
jgi:circadian clock protein KaiC